MNARICAPMSHLDDPNDVEHLIHQLDQQFMGWSDPARRLMQALEQDELVLYAQPIVALREPKTFSMAEVLLRLHEEEAALLPPGVFLPLFEYFRLMPELDRWVARQTVTRLAESPRVACLSINISTQTLTDPEFVPELAAELARAKVSSASLVLEISEQDALERSEWVSGFAKSARAIGCRLTMDGFGRRSVSLAPLNAMRPDFVKVDGVIVRSLHASQSSRNKLNAIVQIAKAIGASVIAECVEKDEALVQLRAASVEYAQGFGIHVPAPINAVIGL